MTVRLVDEVLVYLRNFPKKAATLDWNNDGPCRRPMQLTAHALPYANGQRAGRSSDRIHLELLKMGSSEVVGIEE